MMITTIATHFATIDSKLFESLILSRVSLFCQFLTFSNGVKHCEILSYLFNVYS